jgi:hypothetical protein
MLASPVHQRHKHSHARMTGARGQGVHQGQDARPHSSTFRDQIPHIQHTSTTLSSLHTQPHAPHCHQQDAELTVTDEEKPDNRLLGWRTARHPTAPPPRGLWAGQQQVLLLEAEVRHTNDRSFVGLRLKQACGQGVGSAPRAICVNPRHDPLHRRLVVLAVAVVGRERWVGGLRRRLYEASYVLVF